MNKLFTKIATAFVGMAMAIGVGVAVANNRHVIGTEAASPLAINMTTYANTKKVASAEKVSELDISGVFGDSVISVSASTGGNNGKFYGSISNGTWSNADWRTYQGDSGTVTVSAASGYALTSITFTYNTDKGGCLHTSKTTSLGDNGMAYKSGKAVALSNVSSITAHVANTGTATNGQARITSISVSYASAGAAVKIDGNSTEMTVDVVEGAAALEKTLTLTNVTMGELTIASANTGIASVTTDSENKKIAITGVAKGNTDITIKKGSNLLFTVHVNVASNNVVTVTGTNSVKQGLTLQLSASSSKGSDTFTWATSNEAIATVSNTGLVTGVSAGEVTISATSTNWETTGEKTITVLFDGTYSRGYWFDSSTYDEASGTEATESTLKTAITGSASTIKSISVTGTVASGKGGGLAFGKSSGPGSITIEMKSSATYLKSVSIWGATWDAGIVPTITATNSSDGANTVTQLANGGTFVTKNSPMNDLPLTWTFASDAKTVTIATPGASKSRFIIYQLDLVFTTITPTSVSLSETDVTLMQTEKKNLELQILPRNYNVVVSATWSSNNTDAATVLNGLVTASTTNTGNATITASTTYGNPTCLVKVIELVASSVVIRGETASQLTGAASESLSISGKTWNFNGVLRYTLDYKGSGDTALVYSKNGLRIGSGGNGGSITNDSAYAFKFKKVIVAHCLNAAGTGPYAASYSVSGSDTKGETGDPLEGTTQGMLTTYTFESAVTYVNVASTGGTYISSLTFVFEAPSETVYSAAEFILGLSPDRGVESIGSCTLNNNGTYKAAKKFLYDAGDEVKNEFQTSQDSMVALARTRYTYWAANNHDSSPYDGEDVSSARIGFSLVNNDNNTATIIVIISLVAITAVGGYFFIRKRKAQ